MRAADRLLLALPLLWFLALAAAAGLSSRASAATSRLAPRGAPVASQRAPPSRRQLQGPATIDRLLDERAVLVDDQGERSVLRSTLPPGVEEGTVLDGGLRPWPEEAERRRLELRALRGRLSAGDDGGDIAVGAPW